MIDKISNYISNTKDRLILYIFNKYIEHRVVIQLPEQYKEKLSKEYRVGMVPHTDPLKYAFYMGALSVIDKIEKGVLLPNANRSQP